MIGLILHRTEGSDIFLSPSCGRKRILQLALIHHPAANSGDSSESEYSTVSSAMAQVDLQRKPAAFSLTLTEDHIAGMLDIIFLSLQIYHVYQSRRLDCVDCVNELSRPLVLQMRTHECLNLTLLPPSGEGELGVFMSPAPYLKGCHGLLALLY